MKRRSLSKQEKQYLKQVRKALYVRNSKTKDILAKLRDEMDDLREDGEECESLESVLGTPESIASTYFSEEEIRALQHRAGVLTAIRAMGISQLKFLYPLKTLVFPAFSPPRFGPFPSFFPLREEMRETFFRLSPQPYPAALRKFAWPLWWRGRKCSSWYLHQNVPATPAHPWVLPREREGWSYMYALTV